MSTPWRLIRKEIETTADRYLVCVSGGVDSIFLLDFLVKSSVYLEIVHYDHNMREDSCKDFYLISEYAQKHNLVLSTNKTSPLTKDSNEVDARTARWKFIEEVARDRGFNYIMTAHHADDQVENVFIRLMRGDPHHSLTMQPLTMVNGFYRYKPLLDVDKETIIKQALHFKLSWNEDSTNIVEKYDRNFVRHTLLPLMATRTNVYKSIQAGISKTRLN
jgi:tRNA(Ile)-lysidine synthase